MSDQMWQLLGTLGSIGWCLYVNVSVVIRLLRDFGFERPERLKSIRLALKPFALPCLLATYAHDIAVDPGFWNLVWLGLGLLVWWWYRHDEDDDDRWKRRREKLASKVAEVGGRLQVVPAGAQS